MSKRKRAKTSSSEQLLRIERSDLSLIIYRNIIFCRDRHVSFHIGSDYKVIMIVDGHGISNFVIDYVIARLPVIMADTLLGATCRESVEEGIREAFKRTEKEVDSVFKEGGCVVGCIIRYKDYIFMVQCGNLKICSVSESGSVMYDMPRHDISNEYEVFRVKKRNIFEGYLFGYLKTFRGFGHYNCRQDTITNTLYSKDFKGCKNKYISTPTIAVFKHKEKFMYVIASDGMLENTSNCPKRNFQTEIREFMATGLSISQALFQICERSSKYEHDDITMIASNF